MFERLKTYFGLFRSKVTSVALWVAKHPTKHGDTYDYIEKAVEAESNWYKQEVSWLED